MLIKEQMRKYKVKMEEISQLEAAESIAFRRLSLLRQNTVSTWCGGVLRGGVAGTWPGWEWPCEQGLGQDGVSLPLPPTPLATGSWVRGQFLPQPNDHCPALSLCPALTGQWETVTQWVVFHPPALVLADLGPAHRELIPQKWPQCGGWEGFRGKVLGFHGRTLSLSPWSDVAQ